MFYDVLSRLLVFFCISSAARAQTCTVGDHADSTRFASDFIFGLPASGQSSSYIGDYGCFVQTTQPFGTDFNAARPARDEVGVYTISAELPQHMKLTFTAGPSVTRDTGLHNGTLRVFLENTLVMYLFGANTDDEAYGATAVIPLEYLGQEYFVSVRAGPSPGEVVISSTGEATLICLTPNGPFTYNGISYSAPLSSVQFEIPAWYQMVITSSSNDFTGSRILANTTVSVVSGSACAVSPRQGSDSCDYAMEHLMPYDKWGTIFNVPPFIDGVSTGFYVQITAGRDDTTINVDGTVIGLDQGQTESRDVNSINAILRITSDKPIQVVQVLDGATSMVVIPPEEQYTLQTSYFRLSGASSLDFFFNHFFTIVAPCSSSSGITVTSSVSGFADLAPSSTINGGTMCAYYHQGIELATYTVSQSDPDGAFFVVNYGRYGSAGYAYVGAQKYETQRCTDYQTITCNPPTTTVQTATTSPTTTTPQMTTTITTTTDAPTTTLSTEPPTTTVTTTTQTITTTRSTEPPTTTVTTTTQTITTATSTEIPTTSASTTSVADSRKVSGYFLRRFQDKSVSSSKQIETVEGTTQIRCAQHCLDKIHCQSFSWGTSTQHCILGGSIDSQSDIVQDDGIDIFVRS
ncbi:mucin-22-like [Lytechinus variegatus]|uniref:mucin-22-like n=1 Tax=Lytechinus variegatus TaxID=7654 RepID=UPI001BB2ADC9|nr:mucin-22-like [Lytechinus variegatus]